MSELIAAIVAVVISIAYTEWRTRHGQSQQGHAARTMLSLEIDQNLRSARQLKQRLESGRSGPLFDGNVSRASEWAKALVTGAMPTWNQTIWQSHQTVTAAGLNKDTLGKVAEHHGRIDRITEHHGVLLRLRAQQDQPRPVATGRMNRWIGLAQPFDDNARSNIEPFMADLAALIEQGNPISVEAPTAVARLKRHLNFPT